MNGYMFQESNKTYKKLSLSELTYPFPNKDGIRSISPIYMTHLTDNPLLNFILGFNSNTKINYYIDRIKIEYNTNDNNYSIHEILNKQDSFPIRHTEYLKNENISIIKEYSIETNSTNEIDINLPNLKEYTLYIKNEEP